MYKQVLMLLLIIFVLVSPTYATPVSNGPKPVRTLKQFKMKRGPSGMPVRREQRRTSSVGRCVAGVLLIVLT